MSYIPWHISMISSNVMCETNLWCMKVSRKKNLFRALCVFTYLNDVVLASFLLVNSNSNLLKWRPFVYWWSRVMCSVNRNRKPRRSSFEFQIRYHGFLISWQDASWYHKEKENDRKINHFLLWVSNKLEAESLLSS